ncbi:hypothetical protein [Hymenobacter cellulosilyticus]|uniref:Uncharacterized protein n=1 Tax=Hymenobacter cellulosilyticus TaxID=2932248 RepID=A0A8T9Q2N0_9BACT|nr:hypothetical protein [Hymenobacter cellulosilyticus]UOQ70020.1 hypothetical protein MUN79_14610 [Hymenobacter cellulosilyticus]
MERYRHYSDASRLVLPVMDVLLIYGAFRLAGRMVWGTWQFTGYAPFCFVIFGLLWWLLSGQFANIYRVDKLITYPRSCCI